MRTKSIEGGPSAATLSTAPWLVSGTTEILVISKHGDGFSSTGFGGRRLVGLGRTVHAEAVALVVHGKDRAEDVI